MSREDPGISRELAGAINSDDAAPEIRVQSQDDAARRQEQDAKAARQKKIDEFMTLARKRFKLAEQGEDLQRRRSYEELEFNSGKHWPEELRADREGKDQVVIEVNRTPQYLNQVANEQRMTRPSILTRPVGNGADEDDAKIRQGLIKSIELNSGAEAIRDDAFYETLIKGWSYSRVIWQYESDRSHKKVVRSARIANDFSVYCDPSAVEYDKSDSGFYFITEDMPRDTYNAEYRESQVASMTDFTSLGDEVKDWFGDGVNRVCEYFYRERAKEKLYVMADDLSGDGMFEDELEKDDQGQLIGVAHFEGEPLYRWTMRSRIYWAKINAVEILEGNEDKTAGREYIEGGKYIPIIPYRGKRIFVDRKYIYAGMVRDAIDPCLAADYWLSAITEQVALSSKAPWVVAYEAIAQYREMWDNSNIENYAALFFDAFDADGNQLPAPVRKFGEPPIQAMTFILRYADEDLKRVMGIYAAGLGAPGPETAGVAITARQRESDVANFNYIDNLKRSVEFEAKIYLDFIPKVYKARQVVEIVRPDGKTEMQLINAEYEDSAKKKKNYNMSRGNYGIVVEIGASSNTKREAAAQGINDYIKADPGAAPFVGDVLARNLDFPEKDELARRLKYRARQVAPDLIDQEEQGDDEVPEAFKARYGQLAKRVEELTTLAETLSQRLESDQAKQQHEIRLKAMELASQERREALRTQLDAAALASKTDLELLKMEFAKLQKEIQEFRRPGPVEAPTSPPSNGSEPTLT